MGGSVIGPFSSLSSLPSSYSSTSMQMGHVMFTCFASTLVVPRCLKFPLRLCCLCTPSLPFLRGSRATTTPPLRRVTLAAIFAALAILAFSCKGQPTLLLLLSSLLFSLSLSLSLSRVSQSHKMENVIFFRCRYFFRCRNPLRNEIYERIVEEALKLHLRQVQLLRSNSDSDSDGDGDSDSLQAQC